MLKLLKTQFIFLIIISYSVILNAQTNNKTIENEKIKNSILDVEDKEINFTNLDSNYIINNTHCNNYEDQEQQEEEKPSRIKTLKIAYLTSKLNLNENESVSFWPVYNSYIEELKKLKDINNEVDKDEKVLEIRKKYKINFTKILGAEKSNLVFKSEKEFKVLMQETLIKQKLKQAAEK